MVRNNSSPQDNIAAYVCALWVVGLALWVCLSYWPVNEEVAEGVKFQDVQQQIVSLQRDVALLHEMVKTYKMQHEGAGALWSTNAS